jgi:hypothetical protein
MVVLDDKLVQMLPPPAYAYALSPPPLPSHTSRRKATLTSLPPHILLAVVYHTFPDRPVEKQRRTLYWLSACLRTVSRSFYIGEFSCIEHSPPSLTKWDVVQHACTYCGQHTSLPIRLLFANHSRPTLSLLPPQPPNTLPPLHQVLQCHP